MKTSILKFIALVISFQLSHSDFANCQIQSDYGHEMPVHTSASNPLRVLLVFAELIGSCPDNGSSEWPAGSLPIDAEQYFDANYSTNPSGYITKYFNDMSFGQYVVLGDYPNTVIQIPCSLTNNAGQARDAVVSQLQSRHLANTLTFQGGSSIQNFDNYGSSFHYGYKPPGQDMFIDEIIICFRNLSAQTCQTGSGCTYGNAHYNNVFDIGGIQYGIWSGCGFGICGNAEQACTFILEEMFHDIYGGNNWHLGGGAGNHTFPFATNPWGLATQSAGYGSSNVVSAWDREFCSWTGWLDLNRTVRKAELVSAFLPSNIESNTDLQIPTSPSSSTFVLRDFVKYGDAIKIKLPHLNCQVPGDIKNQYLWIENHQRLNSDFDHSYWEQNSCKDPWSPGLYAYIQVGKDILYDHNGFTVEGLTINQPNALASWLFPLTAEGNFDFAYASTFEDHSWSPCIWNNRTVPIKPFDINTLPNPLTGFSDLYNFYNSNNNANLDRNTDIFPPGLSEVDQGGNIVFNAHSRGDSRDAFSFSNNNSKISLSTNPSSATILTKTSGYDLYPPAPANASYENRTIWLNGVSIEIIEENTNPAIFGPGAIKVVVKWDDYNIDRDVRWCAETINLSPNDFNQANPSLVIFSNKHILLDRGKSPTTCFSTGVDVNNNYLFTLPTNFYCLPNSYVKMESNSQIIVDNGSFFHLQGSSKIIMEASSKIIIKNGSRLILEPNSLIHLKDGASVVIEEGGTIEYQNNADIKIDGLTSVFEIKGNLELKDNSTFTFSHSNASHGYIKFSNSTLFPSRNIIAGNNCNINLAGSSTNRTILEIDQETFYAPSSLVNFNIDGGKVVFNANSRLQADGNATNINFNNVRFTSNTPGLNNGHRGVHLYGQPNISITGCVFEYGRYGIFAYQTYGGSPLNIINSTFRHNNRGIDARDKGLGLFRCNFFNNTIGVNANAMSFPSLFFEGITGGNVASSNVTGINWQSFSTGSLTLEDPLVNTNQTGVHAVNCPLYVKCGSISYNYDGIVCSFWANLFMDDNVITPNTAANVSVFNNYYSIRAVNAWYLWLNKGGNDLSPSSINNEKTAYGTLTYHPLGIIANTNMWNSLGTLLPSDINLRDQNNNPYNIIDNNLQTSITGCGQAVPPCPNQPCPIQSPLEYCPACDEINTDDFTGVKLNIATQAALDKLNSNDPDQYKDAVALFSQILNEQYLNPDDKEKYLLSLNYIKMMEALGNAFKYNQLQCLENGMHDLLNQVIAIQDLLITNAVQIENHSVRLKYSLDKAQTLRLACRRTECVDFLNEILNWAVGEEEIASVNLFICQVNIEILLMNGTIRNDEVEAYLTDCGGSTARVRNHSEVFDQLNPPKQELEVEVFNKSESGFVEIKTNAENGHLVMLNSIGEVVHEVDLVYETTIDVSLLSKGIYFINTSNSLNGQKMVNKIVIH